MFNNLMVKHFPKKDGIFRCKCKKKFQVLKFTAEFKANVSKKSM